MDISGILITVNFHGDRLHDTLQSQNKMFFLVLIVK